MEKQEPTESLTNYLNVPKDKWNLAFVLFFFQGLGVLYPWNVFINASSYIGYRVCDSYFADPYLSFISVGYNLANISGLLFSIRYAHKYSLNWRGLFPLSLMVAMSAITTCLVFVTPETLPAVPFFLITLCCVLISGFMSSILQGAIYGLAGQCPPVYVGAVMSGNGLAGVIVSASSLLTLLESSDAGTNVNICLQKYEDVSGSSFAYFLVSTLVLGICILGFMVLIRLPIVLYYMEKSTSSSDNDFLLQNETSNSEDLITPDSPVVPSDEGKANVFAVLSKVWDLSFTVFAVFWITLSVFPATTNMINPIVKSGSTSMFLKDTVFHAFSQLNFNVMDTLGRLTANTGKLPKGTLWVKFLVASRVVFILLFLFCQTSTSHYTTLAPDLFKSNVAPILIMALFAYSNGALSTQVMMLAPDRVSNHEKDLAGTVMVFSLVGGLFAGSLSSFAFIPLVKNPGS